MRAHRVAGALLLLTLVPLHAFPQALTSLASVRTGYTTRKATVRPTGELKAQIDEIDRQLAEANRLGKTGEVRRLFAKGNTLLNGREWTDILDFTNSLVIRTEQVVADSSQPYAIRLEQLYSPTIELSPSLTAHILLRKRAPGAAQAGEVVKDLGAFDGVSRDLRESPFRIEIDVRGVPDGAYQLAAEIADGARALGAATLQVDLR